MKIALITLGGTLLSSRSGSVGVSPNVRPDEIVGRLGPLEDTDMEVIAVAQLPSVDLDKVTLGRLAEIMLDVAAADTGGFDGIVVVQGTDTLADVSFWISLWWPGYIPVVVTGAMRSFDDVGFDGLRNVRDAIAVGAALSEGEGSVLVVLNEEIHFPAAVIKHDPAGVGAFQSKFGLRAGIISEGRVVLTPGFSTSMLRCGPRFTMESAVASLGVRVGIYYALLNDCDLGSIRLDALGGLVVAGFGAGHVNRRAAEVIEQLAERLPIVLASQTIGGQVATMSYDFVGSEVWLASRGVVNAGILSVNKSAVLLKTCISNGYTMRKIGATFSHFRL